MTLKEMIEKRNAAVEELEKINNACEKRAENGEDPALTEQEAKTYDERAKEIDSLEKLIENTQNIRSMKLKKFEAEDDGEGENGGEKRAEEIEKEEREAFRAYIISSVKGVAERAGNNLTAGNNGAIIPKSIANKVIDKVENICDVYDRVSKYSFKGEVSFPVIDTSAGDVIVGYADEFSELTSHVNGFTSVKLSGYLYSALALIGKSAIINSDIDVVGIVITRMALALKKFLEKQCLIGTSDKMTGILSTTNIVESAASTAITCDELIDLQDTVPDALQGGCVWYMHPKTRSAIRKLKDSDGDYIMTKDLSGNFPNLILGKPVIVSDIMPEIGAGNKAIFYGDPSGLYVNIREDMNIQVLVEKYSEQHAIGINLWAEMDSKIVEPQKLAVLKCKA